MSSKRKNISVKLEVESANIGGGTLSGFIKELKALQAIHGDKFYINVESTGYDFAYLTLEGTRPETDEEFAARLAEEDEKREERRRETAERLKEEKEKAQNRLKRVQETIRQIEEKEKNL